jgi:predicted transcriptional regulator
MGWDEQMSTTVRISDEVQQAVKRIAALQGRTPSDLIAEAWDDYLRKHREQFAADFEQAAALIRAGEIDRLAEFASQSVADRAVAAAEAARGQGSE